MNFKNFVSPKNLSSLKIHMDRLQKSRILSGYYQDEDGIRFEIVDDIPDFTYPKTLNHSQKSQLEYYDSMSEDYDQIQKLTFQIQRDDEILTRKTMVKCLNLKHDDKVLELACGTGLDSVHIVEKLGEESEFHAMDISKKMLEKCRNKLITTRPKTTFVVGNASYLPYPDNYFDALFSFGGFNVFSDPKRSLSEMVRVTKVGGRIVFGDESMPPWLRDTEFSKILVHSNPLFKYDLPIDILPVEARNVSVKWIIGGVYYLIAFEVGEGEPKANIDIAIPGKRGGTLRTRYYGQLEGVEAEIKEKISELAKKNKEPINDWLNKSLRKMLANEEL